VKEEYEPPTMKITQKQVDKHLHLCDKFDCKVELPAYELVEDESEADQIGAWYGRANSNNKPGIMYIGILPDGSSHS
jgi:hypothetical protein